MAIYRLHYFPESENSYKIARMLTLWPPRSPRWPICR